MEFKLKPKNANAHQGIMIRGWGGERGVRKAPDRAHRAIQREKEDVKNVLRKNILSPFHLFLSMFFRLF